MTEEKQPNEEQTKDTEIEKQEEGVPTLVTPLHPIDRQVGEHVLAAMEHQETVAVLTTITGSKSGPQVISIPLDQEHLSKVHALIEEIHKSDEPEHVPCVGFHCYLNEESDT